MFNTYNAGQKVGGGFYFNTTTWAMRVAPREGDVLPGEAGERYIALPTVMLLVAAPLLSFLFVIFLPFIGIALMVKAGYDKIGVLLHEARTAEPGAVVRGRVTK